MTAAHFLSVKYRSGCGRSVVKQGTRQPKVKYIAYSKVEKIVVRIENT